MFDFNDQILEGESRNNMIFNPLRTTSLQQLNSVVKLGRRDKFPGVQ